jgi:hypothetical protein
VATHFGCHEKIQEYLRMVMNYLKKAYKNPRYRTSLYDNLNQLSTLDNWFIAQR